MIVPRRQFVRVMGVGALAAATAKATEREAPVTPVEDLSQEHGLLQRLLLVYDEVARRLEDDIPVDPDTAASAARIVQRFVEDYHERNEELFVFSNLEHTRLAPLITVLKEQHRSGRIVTARILTLSRGRGGLPLAQQLRAFERMYRPHAAREDTVLFPALRATLAPSVYRELGERMEQAEHRALGDRGFEHNLNDVAKIEAALRIEELDQFTPS
jgi:hemerythrin-like domain-containing protein